MDSRSPSPPLPTFGIRDLSGPQPGLISITKRQYESTIKSQPDAKLLYLDDDDGELITVGSALELSQRLEEPVLRYTRGTFTETYNPVDDRLVHVFDINHSSGSLAEWRDHEAYSSKNLRRPSLTSSDSACGSFPTLQPATFHDAIAASPKSSAMRDAKEEQSLPPVQTRHENPEQEEDELEPVDILGGVERHLNGLASVLQLAADTMQRAASRTRETDATVIEDILRGVKDILVEVGSFGAEVYKELNHSEDANLTTESETEAPALPVEMENPFSSALDTSSTTTEEISITGPEALTPSGNSSSSTDTRVKFAFVEDEIDDLTGPAADSSPTRLNCFEESDEDDVSEYDDANPNIIESQIFKPVEPPVSDRAVNPSILDDSSEDADFTARYPPLHTVRRARSTIEKSLNSHFCLAPEPPSHDRVSYILPAERRGGKLWEDSFCSASRQTNNEIRQKPLPGAWPDAKNDSAPVLPISSESSGAFFNRMTGRMDEKEKFSTLGIHRSNTTASSNPASRLNGPFDPGFPYEPSKGTHMSLRSHRRPYHQFRDLSDQVSARSSQAATNARAKLEAKRSIPSFACSARRGPISLVDERPKSNSNDNAPSFTKFDSHRAVKHHRSVPHFRPYIPSSAVPTLQLPARTASTRSNWVSQLSMPPADYLTGNNVPSAPLNSFPAVAPQPYVPTPPPQSPPAPQLKPFMPSPNFAPSSASTSFSSPLYAFAEPSRSQNHQNIQMLERGHVVHRSSSSSSAISPISSPEAERVKNKFDLCVEKLQMCGFGIDDENLKDRLHVYAVAANGDVEEAVDMIEEDRRVSGRFE